MAEISEATRARVLHVLNGDEYGGIERVSDLLAVTLPSSGYEAVFACVKPGDHASLLRERRWRSTELPMRSRADLRVVPALAGLARRDGCAAIHSHTPRAAMVGRAAAAAAGLPLIHHVHGSAVERASEIAAAAGVFVGLDPDVRRAPALERAQFALTRPAVWAARARNRLTSAVERASVAGAAAVCVVSRPLAEEMRSLGVPARRIAIVPNGVAGPATLPARDPPAGEWLVGTAARLGPRKGIGALLRAVAEARRRGTPVRLRVLGDFDTAAYGERMRALSRGLGIAGHVEWAGFRADMPRELRRLDAFVLPSLYEGMPMAVLEAMAWGVPVIASRVGGIPDALGGGACGVLVTPGDVGELATALIRLVRGEPDWRILRERAHRRQRREFSAEVMSARVAEVYRWALTGRAALPR